MSLVLKGKSGLNKLWIGKREGKKKVAGEGAMRGNTNPLGQERVSCGKL